MLNFKYGEKHNAIHMYISARYLLFIKGTLQWRNPADTTLIMWSRKNIISNMTNQHHVPPDLMHWGGHSILLFLVTAEHDTVHQWGSSPGSAILSMLQDEYLLKLVFLFLEDRLTWTAGPKGAHTLSFERSCQTFLQQGWPHSSRPCSPPPQQCVRVPLSFASVHHYNLPDA